MDQTEGFPNTRKESNKPDCSRFGGPEDPSFMEYWRTSSSSSSSSSLPIGEQPPPEIRLPSHENKFVTFELDEGGWNNIRMGFETAAALAVATGRILVLPPTQKMYLLDHPSLGLDQFYPLDNAELLRPLRVWSLERFLRWRRDLGLTVPTRPTSPNSTATTATQTQTEPSVSWDGSTLDELSVLHDWMRQHLTVPQWNYRQCIVVIPPSIHGGQPSNLTVPADKARTQGHKGARLVQRQYGGKPTPIDAPAQARALEVLSHRRNKLCLYDESVSVLHLPGSGNDRYLVHFYAFVFAEDWRLDLWIKRFVRDRFRYADAIQCAAARIVQELEKLSAGANTNTSIGNSTSNDSTATFDAMHVRRGDFKMKKAWLPAEAMYDQTLKHTVPEHTLLYIATAEKNKTFYEFFHQYYDVRYLDDFKDQLGDLPFEFYGNVDQLVASQARTFVGCYYSTFSGYINRIRGYQTQKRKRRGSGWRQGIVDSYYYAPFRRRDVMRTYFPIVSPMTAQDFAISWRLIDEVNGEQQYTDEE